MLSVTASVTLYNPSFTMTNLFAVSLGLLIHDSYTVLACGGVPPTLDLATLGFKSFAQGTISLNPIRNLRAKSSTTVRFNIQLTASLTSEIQALCARDQVLIIFPEIGFLRGSTAVGDVIFLPTLGDPFKLPCQAQMSPLSPDEFVSPLFPENSNISLNYLPLTYI